MAIKSCAAGSARAMWDDVAWNGAVRMKTSKSSQSGNNGVLSLKSGNNVAKVACCETAGGESFETKT